MIEVEIKLPIPDRNHLEQQLLQIGFEKEHLVKEFDLYFNHPSRNFKQTDEALRIRNTRNFSTGAQSSVITYKGAKIDTVSMTRKELETGIENPHTVEEILTALGFTQRFPVVKTRQYYTRGPLTACVDRVQQLGDFLELEIIVPGEDERTTALATIQNTLCQLGYAFQNTTRESYLCMLQKKQENS